MRCAALVDFRSLHCGNQPGGGCTVKSVGSAKPGEIVTQTLMGELGEVKSSEAASGVGVLLLPASAKKLETIVSTKCTPETVVTGSVAGEVTPVGSLEPTEEFVLGTGSGKQDIRRITVKGVGLPPGLVAFSTTATLGATYELSVRELVEVT